MTHALPALPSNAAASPPAGGAAGADADDLAPTLRTERLLLRPLVAGDAEALFAIFSDPRVVRYLSRPAWTSIESAHERIAQDAPAGAARSHLRLGVEVAATGAVVGECSIFNIHAQSRRAEIGYALAPAAWGSGYVHEALVALLDHAFGRMQLHRLEADIDPRNERSARVLQRLGFREEGRLRERWFVAGEMSDTALYGLLARDPRAPARVR